MTTIKITAGGYHFTARLEERLAPKTCTKFLSMLPYYERIIHVRWGGEACWIPLGELDYELDFENTTSYPAPGQILFYPGGSPKTCPSYSEAEILLSYGAVRFGSKMGQLAGNHFLTIVEGVENLPELGRKVLWEGAQDIVFSL